MIKIYELGLDKAVFWQRAVVDDEVKYIKKNVDSKFDTLQFFRIGNPSWLPCSDGMWFRECFSGRLLSIDESNDKIIIYPCGFDLPKESLKRIKSFNSYTDDIMISDKNMDDYINVSEDFLFNSYFCNLINEETGLNEMPEELLKKKINEINKINENTDFYDRNGKKLNRKK